MGKNKSGFMIKVQVYWSGHHVGHGYLIMNHKYQMQHPILIGDDGYELPENYYELRYESEMIPVVIDERVN